MSRQKSGLKKADQKWAIALKKEINKKVLEAIDALKEVELSVKAILGTILNVEDLNRVGDLYHVVNQLDYWFECSIENNDNGGRIQALREVSNFLKNIKEGEGT